MIGAPWTDYYPVQLKEVPGWDSRANHWNVPQDAESTLLSRRMRRLPGEVRSDKPRRHSTFSTERLPEKYARFPWTDEIVPTGLGIADQTDTRIRLSGPNIPTIPPAISVSLDSPPFPME